MTGHHPCIRRALYQPVGRRVNCDSQALGSSYLIASLPGTASSKPGTNSMLRGQRSIRVARPIDIVPPGKMARHWRRVSRMETAVMKVLKRAAVAAAYTASVAISFLVLLLCSACLLSGASLVLVGMSALGSGLMALMEFRSSFKTIG